MSFYLNIYMWFMWYSYYALLHNHMCSYRVHILTPILIYTTLLTTLQDLCIENTTRVHYHHLYTLLYRVFVYYILLIHI